jgi:hypothetical protein
VLCNAHQLCDDSVALVETGHVLQRRVTSCGTAAEVPLALEHEHEEVPQVAGDDVIQTLHGHNIRRERGLLEVVHDWVYVYVNVHGHVHAVMWR